jgi:hypothetical protein
MLSEIVSTPVEPEMRTFITDIAYARRVSVSKIVRTFLEYAAQEYKTDSSKINLPSGWTDHKPAQKK